MNPKKFINAIPLFLAGIGSLLVLISLFIKIFAGFTNGTKGHDYQYIDEQLRKRDSIYNIQLNAIQGSVQILSNALGDTAKINSAAGQVQISQMKQLLIHNTEAIEALRQSFNPNKPEEVLTIVRMKDKLDSQIDYDKQLETRLTAQMMAFQENIKSQTSNTWLLVSIIGVALLPFLIQMMLKSLEKNKMKTPEVTE
jgi:hypothetical protein